MTAGQLGAPPSPTAPAVLASSSPATVATTASSPSGLTQGLGLVLEEPLALPREVSEQP